MRHMKQLLIHLQSSFNTRKFVLGKNPKTLKVVSKYLIAQPLVNTTYTTAVINPACLKNMTKLLIRNHSLSSIRASMPKRSPVIVKQVSSLTISQPFLNP
ncbi:Hypothetical predicted protein [Marmota monax]|uniref:Uncharacterized protein n=1 Tax=Marmota monax TaxID=9995 RepID=A0A5E4CZF6_MARMO|nr:hypothetical protein GHT09_018636 [Marmota monax]VTJ86391.1 Hypothetical predicted protein [Marmota monax]